MTISKEEKEQANSTSGPPRPTPIETNPPLPSTPLHAPRTEKAKNPRLSKIFSSLESRISTFGRREVKKVVEKLRKLCGHVPQKISKDNNKKPKPKKNRTSSNNEDLTNDQLFKQLVYIFRYLHFVDWKQLAPEGCRESVCGLNSF